MALTDNITQLDIINAVNANESDAVKRLSSVSATGSTTQGVYVDANGQVQVCEAVTSTYSVTGTAPVNGMAVASAISNKQDTISDLETIRAGATSGASALQPSDVTSTYNASGTAPVDGTAVAQAISGKASIVFVDWS